MNSPQKIMQSINFDRRESCFLQESNTALPSPERDLPRNIQRAIQIVAVGHHPEILPANANLRVLVCELLRCLPFKAPRSAVIVKKSFLALRLGKGQASVHRYLRKLEELGVIRRGDQAITRREGAQIGEIYFTDAALLAMGFFTVEQNTNSENEQPPSPAFSAPKMIDAKRGSQLSDASEVDFYSSLKKSQPSGEPLKESSTQEQPQNTSASQTGRIPAELVWLTALPSCGLTVPQIFQLMGMCRKAYGCNLAVIVLPIRAYIENNAKEVFPYIKSLMTKGMDWFNKLAQQQEMETTRQEVSSHDAELQTLHAKAKAFEGIPFLGSSGYVLTIVNGVVRRFNPQNTAESIGDVLLTEGFFEAVEAGRLVKYQTA